jgi:nicotinamidase/pyrazinamidase
VLEFLQLHAKGGLGGLMQSQRVLWAVDVQRDFMLPGGALYVPGAEKLLANIKDLVDLARRNSAFLISSACQHTPDDPEFQTFPPHCVRGTPGAELVAEALAEKLLRIPNQSSFSLPEDWFSYQQVLLEKQVLDVFTNPNTSKLLEQLPVDAEFIVFGVVTEYCVQFAAKGLLDRKRRVAVVADAIETLKRAEGDRTISDLASRGARLIATHEAIAEVESHTNVASIQRR